jgi:hypothetical protein
MFLSISKTTKKRLVKLKVASVRVALLLSCHLRLSAFVLLSMMQWAIGVAIQFGA